MLTVKELAEALGAEVLCEGDIAKEVTGGYCGDLLSWVMSRARAGDCWFTVMGNVNSIGVAVLADVACIVLTDSASLDGEALLRAKENGVCILSTAMNSYKAGTVLSKLL